MMPPWEPPFLTSKVPLVFLEMKRKDWRGWLTPRVKEFACMPDLRQGHYERVADMSLGYPGSVQLSGQRGGKGSSLEFCQT